MTVCKCLELELYGYGLDTVVGLDLVTKILKWNDILKVCAALKGIHTTEADLILWFSLKRCLIAIYYSFYIFYCHLSSNS